MIVVMELEKIMKNFYIFGATDGNLGGDFNKGAVDGFISKFDKNWNMLWTNLIGSENGDNGVRGLY